MHLTSEAFQAQAGVDLTQVPYKGTALAIPDLASGQVQLLFDSIPSGMPHVKSGRVRALAVTGGKRSALAPELPTVAEAGLGRFLVDHLVRAVRAGRPEAGTGRAHQRRVRAGGA